MTRCLVQLSAPNIIETLLFGHAVWHLLRQRHMLRRGNLRFESTQEA